MTFALDLALSQWSEPFFDVLNSGKLPLDIAEASAAQVLIKSAQDITEAELNGRQQLIAFEKTDGANIAFRHILKHPNTVRYVKAYNYSSIDLHNEACVDGRLFTRYLQHNVPMQKVAPLIDDADFTKIRLGWNFLHYHRLRKLIAFGSELFFMNERPIDVFFAGTLEYDNSGGIRKSADLISQHRKSCLDVLESMKGLKIVLIKGKHLSLNEYNRLMLQSKIVVSPWGWGDTCYRDYEAILAGCALVKPASGFVVSACNINSSSYCNWTKPDFSNLEEVIWEILTTFDASVLLRKINRERLLDRISELPVIMQEIFNF